MKKRSILVCAAALSMIATTGNSVVALADTVGTQQVATNSSIIAGSKTDKADTTIGHLPTVQSVISYGSAQQAITQATSNYATPAQQQAFLANVGPIAQRVANQYGLYASVMLAQAILESGWGMSTLSMAPNNNYFGMKGDYNGQSYSVVTREWSAEKGNYYITAAFRKYPDIQSSFADNGNKLRNGVAWDASYYKGTWKENTSSYKDATAWLQGRYATSNVYAASLNNVIATYNLTQYDSNAPTNPNTNGSTQAPSTDDQITQINGVVTVGPSITKIYTTEHKLSNRALLGGTDWRTDKRSVHADGSVWYRVSTSEWVSADEVTYK